MVELTKCKNWVRILNLLMIDRELLRPLQRLLIQAQNLLFDHIQAKPFKIMNWFGISLILVL